MLTSSSCVCAEATAALRHTLRQIHCVTIVISGQLSFVCLFCFLCFVFTKNQRDLPINLKWPTKLLVKDTAFGKCQIQLLFLMIEDDRDLYNFEGSSLVSCDVIVGLHPLQC